MIKRCDWPHVVANDQRCWCAPSLKESLESVTDVDDYGDLFAYWRHNITITHFNNALLPRRHDYPRKQRLPGQNPGVMIT